MRKQELKKKSPKVVADDLISSKKLDMWIKNKYNVMFEGRHGVGKTAIILDAFKRAGLRYIYLSGSTMDPFIDFVGVPVKVKDAKGHERIELIRPKHIVEARPQAIFIDEFNRTHKKVRNAVMELLQFKTINGKEISDDLRIIWAAVNPEDEDGEYDVDKIDPAQKDRFQIFQRIPFKCSAEFFRSKFGKKGETAVVWWNKLESPIQAEVSPRRLEYALDLFNRGGDMKDVLPLSCNPARLSALLRGKGYLELDSLLKEPEKAKAFFENEQNYVMHISDVLREPKYNRLIEALPEEKLTALLVTGKNRDVKVVKNYIQKLVVKGYGETFRDLLTPLASVGQNGGLRLWAQRMLDDLDNLAKAKVPKFKMPKPTTAVTVRPITNASSFMSCIGKMLCDAAAKGTVVGSDSIKAFLSRKIQRHTSEQNIANHINGKIGKWLAGRGYQVTSVGNPPKGAKYGWKVATI